jgi:hypothetical protein
MQGCRTSLWSSASSFHNNSGSSTSMDIETLRYIMKACIIMHTMIIEDEGDVDQERFDDEEENVRVSHHHTPDLLEFIKTRKEIRDSEIHHQL